MMMQRPMMIQQERQHYNHNKANAITNTVAGLYDLEETLGSGHFAVVKLARHVFTGEKVAVKVIDKTKLDDISKAHLFQEVRCMKLVQHPHVVRLYEVIDTQTKLYLILELGDGGDLYDYIMRHDAGLSESLAREYFRQIVRAISYCHQLHVVHRDLKPENCVFFEKLGVVKLTDFGFSNKFCPGQKLETSCGSLAYSAPEILLGDSYDAPAVDVWSLGVILYMLVCGQPPFQEANDSETLTMIMDCKYTMPPHISSECRRLIASMLVREPEKRATIEQIANDSWLSQGEQSQPEYLPLVSKEQVSDEDHSFIVQKMVNGNIAQKDEILEALDRNEYNHITATYFLLAERKLRAHRPDQQIKKKPDLTLPLSPAKNECSKLMSQDDDDDEQDNNLLVVPGIINAPRTPGDMSQKGRNRKCSIVQEEDDDIGDEEPSSPLNRRGSRSEGRINLTVQDRLAAEVAERLKKEQHSKIHAKSQEPDLKVTTANTRSLIDGIAGVKIIKNDDKEKFLGQAGSGLRKDVRSGSVDKNQVRPIRGPMDIKILTDSSTIPAINVTPMIINQISKPFKTMPSPTRSALMQQNANLNNNSCLKEILECDTGSSDTSNTNTPRPILRSQAVATTSSTATSHHRRTKFHKSRTTSCSSSDASDDDNNSEKKRAGTKIIDCGITKQIITQRRDSDSSDSQDPGSNTCSGNNNAGSSLILRNGSNTTSSNNKSSSPSGTSHESRGKSTSNSSEIGYRRHRTGRRRQTETRLRESQSLNRITEVQECEHNNFNNNNNNNNNSITNNNSTEKIDRSKIEDSQEKTNEPIKNPSNNDILMTSSNSMKISTLNNLNSKVTSPSSNDTIQNVTNELKANKNQNNTKAKGFSARFLQNLNFKRNHDATQTNSSKSSNKSNRNSMPDVPLTKLNSGKIGSHVRSSSQMPSDGSDRSKKIKILGRYFQVHKKICQPLSGLFRTSGSARLSSSNLYKAQSCSSIVRDGIHHSINNTTLSTSSSSVTKHSTKFDEKLLNEREYLIKNCLGSRFIGSDGDINEKSLDKQQQLLEYIDDDLLSGSKC
ncbi:SNF-related serine/threonine-protein kinase isoform X2 [Chironomus tepperi]|uniref:SNF-related serine/threonine-protein kinase isoform X2 n=1 Tax=Chironomus tepperi TaxID=113505 RepID=UPI00391F06F9